MGENVNQLAAIPVLLDFLPEDSPSPKRFVTGACNF